MKTSEQARKAAAEIKDPIVVIEDSFIIQTAIDSHERDLVEAAEKYLKAHQIPSVYDIPLRSAYEEIKAALDRRRE